MATGDKIVKLDDLKTAYDTLNANKLSLSGGTMTGNINMGQASASSTAKIIQWTTTDGTVFQIRPYNNVFQLVRTQAGGTTSGVLNIDSNGNISVADPANWRSALGVVAKSGDTITGNLMVKNPTANTTSRIYIESTNSSGGLDLRSDAEGGNIKITGPDGTHFFELDMYNNDALRIYSYDDSNNIKSFVLNRKTGAFTSSSLTPNNALGTDYGGTGSKTVDGGRNNLKATYGAYVDDSTWADLWTNFLSKISINGHAVALFNPDASNVLTDNKINATLGVTIYRGGSDSSRSFRIMAVSDTGQLQYSWRILEATASSRTTGTIYKFTGTAI